MIKISSSEQFDSVLSSECTYCVLFIHKDSPPCSVMRSLLDEICRVRGIDLFIADIEDQFLYKYIIKFSVGVLPRYIFIKDGEELYSDKGTEIRLILEKELRKVGI